MKVALQSPLNKLENTHTLKSCGKKFPYQNYSNFTPTSRAYPYNDRKASCNYNNLLPCLVEKDKSFGTYVVDIDWTEFLSTEI